MDTEPNDPQCEVIPTFVRTETANRTLDRTLAATTIPNHLRPRSCHLISLSYEVRGLERVTELKISFFYLFKFL